NAILYGLGALLLGAIGLYFHDFAHQWQPVPADIAYRTQLAYLSGVLLIVGGAAVLSRKGERGGALLLAAFYGFWVVALHLPLAIASYTHIGAWNGPAEIGFKTAGGIALFAAGAGRLRVPLNLVARYLAGLSAIVFAFAHFNYAEFTATMVPGWIPYKLFWAYATGAGH